MLRRSPPLEAIEIFVAVAYAESFRAAARGLALSPSAVSRRIASLEAFLGVALFDRSGSLPALNATGRRYLAQIEPAMKAICRATTFAIEKDTSKIRVATSHSFANAWLSPRLGDLQRSEGIEIDIVPTRDLDVLRSGEAQLAIWGGLSIPNDMAAETIVQAEVIPVAAPVMADGRLPPQTEDELMERRLLTVGTPANLWQQWFVLSGQRREPTDVREFATLQLAYEAAAAGLGVALAIPLIAEPYLRTGRLLPCAPAAREIGECYRLYRPRRRAKPPEAELRFANWLRKAARKSVDEFQAYITAGLGSDHADGIDPTMTPSARLSGKQHSSTGDDHFR
jgi:LysR family glycine cleavage system transcriptional activator